MWDLFLCLKITDTEILINGNKTLILSYKEYIKPYIYCIRNKDLKQFSRNPVSFS